MRGLRLGLASFVLVVALGFYVAHRPDATLANRVVRVMLGEERADEVKAWLVVHFPVAGGLKGCLPSALWVLAATSVVGGWRLNWSEGRGLPLVFLPVVFNGLWEGVQWAGLTDGRADGADVVAGLVGWGFSVVLPSETMTTPVMADGWRDRRLAVLVGVCAVIGFADVL